MARSPRSPEPTRFHPINNHHDFEYRKRLFSRICVQCQLCWNNAKRLGTSQGHDLWSLILHPKTWSGLTLSVCSAGGTTRLLLPKRCDECDQKSFSACIKHFLPPINDFLNDIPSSRSVCYTCLRALMARASARAGNLLLLTIFWYNFSFLFTFV